MEPLLLWRRNLTLNPPLNITVHTDAAMKHGATREEIAEALEVAIAVSAGAALVYSARVMDAYSAKAA
jgi:alkylhydroperoxidase/carboxymuconolactone decarboxylase family protein YurZ